MMQLINQAVKHAISNNGDAKLADHCATYVKCIKNLLKILASWLLNMVHLRRDSVLQKLSLSPDQLFDLQHSDYASNRLLFPEELVRELDLKFRQNLQNRALLYGPGSQTISQHQ